MPSMLDHHTQTDTNDNSNPKGDTPTLYTALLLVFHSIAIKRCTHRHSINDSNKHTHTHIPNSLCPVGTNKMRINAKSMTHLNSH